jgi:hypothetical protein
VCVRERREKRKRRTLPHVHHVHLLREQVRANTNELVQIF